MTTRGRDVLLLSCVYWSGADAVLPSFSHISPNETLKFNSGKLLVKYLPALLVLKVATARKKPPSNRNRREHFSRIVRRNSSSNEKKRSNDFRSEKKEVEKEHQESFLGKKGIEVKGCLLAC